jgi:hypothetical protein
MRPFTIFVAAVAISGIAIHAAGLMVGAGGARIVGLAPYLLGFVALGITRSPVVGCCAMAVPLLIDIAFLADFLTGTSGGVAGLGHEWAMMHYVKLLVLFPVGLYVGIRLADPAPDEAPSNNTLERTRDS